jgi:hypothetical protein
MNVKSLLCDSVLHSTDNMECVLGAFGIPLEFNRGLFLRFLFWILVVRLQS